MAFEKIMENKKEDLTIKLSSEVQNQFKAFLQNISNSMKPLQQQFAILLKNIQPEIKQFFEIYNEIFKQLPEILRYVLIELANRGWFITMSIEIPDIHQLAELIKNEKEKEINKFMGDFIENDIENIMKNIFENFPKRKKIILKAYHAHKKKDYELSIPIFLIQADGICLDILNKNLYSRCKNGTPRIAKSLKELGNGWIKNSFIELLRNPNLYNFWKNEPFYSKTLNRNKILHGESINYGTNINSLKIISLLYYLSKDINNAIKQKQKNIIEELKNER